MVNRPEWNSVAAPDFSVALQALQSAGNRFDAGVGAARSGFNAFDAVKTDQVSKAFALQMARFQDPAELQAALAADPTLGVAHADRLSTAELGSGDNQVTALLAQAASKNSLRSAEGNLAQTERDRAITNSEDDAFRAAAPKVNEYIMTSRTDPAKAAAMLEADPELKALPPARLNALLTGGMSMRTSQLGLDNTQMASDMQIWNNANTKQDKTDADQITALGELIGADNLDAASVPGWVNTHREELLAKGFTINQIAGARGKAMATIAGFGPAPTTGAGDPNAGVDLSGGESKNSYDVVYGDSANGNSMGFTTPKPPSEMTLGEVYDYGKNVMIPKTRAAGIGMRNGKAVGTSAVGKYQIVSSTLERIAPTVLGADWRSKKFDAAAQDKLGEYLFNESKGGNLKAVWAGLPSSRPGAYKDLSWDSMKQIITQHESRVGGGKVGTLDPRAVGKTINDHATGAGLNATRNPNFAVAADFAAAALDVKSTPRQIAAKLVGPGGELAGEDIGNVTDQISSVMNGNKDVTMSAAAAGRVLARSVGGNKSTGAMMMRDTWWGDGLKANINPDQLKANIAIYRDKQLMKDAVSTSNETAASVADSQAALKSLVTARAAYVAKRAQYNARGIKNPDLSQEAAAVNAAEAMVRAAGARVQGMDESGNTSSDTNRNPPPAAPRAPPKRVVAVRPAVSPARFNQLLNQFSGGPAVVPPKGSFRRGDGSMLMKR